MLFTSNIPSKIYLIHTLYSNILVEKVIKAFLDTMAEGGILESPVQFKVGDK
jgi:hypothetical protein